MVIYYSSKFEKEYRRLPNAIKKLAEKKERLFCKNPFDKQLKTHKLKGRLSEFYSFYFHSVGTHSIYN